MPGVLIWGYEPTTKTWIPIKVDADGVVQVYDPKVGSLISYSGTTTADGAGDGTTLVCSNLTTKPDYNGNLVIITSGDYEGQARDINGVTTGGTVTPASAFGGQIVSGVTFVIVGIRTVPAEVAALLADIGDASASTLGNLYAILGNPAQTYLAMIGYEGATALANKLTAARATLLDEITAGRMSELDAANIPADTDPKVMGRAQIFEKSITSAANAGDVTVATITDQPCRIESIVIHADTAQTANMISCGVFGGAGKVITFISAADAIQAELDAEDKQVRWTGEIRLAATKTIVISLVGSDGAAVDLTISIKYRAAVSGGYLT